jgi:cytidylate kinase
MPAGTAATAVLISRGTMSGAQRIGQCLSRTANLQCVSREDLLAAVNTYGDIATRIAARVAKAERAYEEFSEIRRPYQILMRRALMERIREGRVAYFGYSGHLLLPRIQHFVRVRLIAPIATRIAGARVALGCSEDDARDYVRQVDQERAQWTRVMYGVDLRDPAGYDLCINLERLSLPGACDLLVHIVEQSDFQPSAASAAQFENEFLATQTLAALTTNPASLHLEIGAHAEQGIVSLVGPYLSEEERDAVLAIAAAVPGVVRAEYEPGYAPAFSYAS